MNNFDEKIQESIGEKLMTKNIHTIQVNITLKCNQECTHCHHKAGPEREEMMNWETMERIVEISKNPSIEIIDITGGAPEEHPELKRFVEALKDIGKHVMVRTNLTALMKEKNRYLAEFFRDNSIELIASLPCYEVAEVDCVRGDGVFDTSIEGLKLLNSLGYGRNDDLKLNLVFNPMADFLPPPQGALLAEYKEILKKEHDIDFTSLFTITNMPIGRFWEDLKKKGKDDQYMKLLMDNFNPTTVDALMCRYQISIGWDGTIYDCDFNQALGLGVVDESPKNITEIEGSGPGERPINTGIHCFGCTAGAGSSCGGALLED
jgi:radical SAM/Cys-rich protein